MNCVRWNNIGTLFASASDDGCVVLWEYVGEIAATSFQKYSMQSMTQTNNKKMGLFETNDNKKGANK